MQGEKSRLLLDFQTATFYAREWSNLQNIQNVKKMQTKDFTSSKNDHHLPNS